MIDQAISHYRIQKKLGAGGMGEVYLAHDSTLDRPVALKILPSEFVSNSDRLRLFIKEAKAASAVNHPNVCHIYEIGKENGIHFIAMEYIEGESLADRMDRTKIQPTEIAKIALQVCDALEAAHAKGIVHRDIKPANIMISSGQLVKLVDFGLARVEHKGTDMSSLLSTASQTEIGTILGTLPYMSPEQVLGKPVDHRSDFFSLGIVLYQMAAAELPFRGNTTAELADSIVHKDPVPLREKNRHLPQELEKTIIRMLSKEQEKRPQNASEILNNLQKFRAQQSSSAFIFELFKKPVFAIPAVLILLSLIGAAIWTVDRIAKKKWAREEALTKITKLADEDKYKEAVALALQAEEYLSDDPTLKKLWTVISQPITIKTDPPGADVFFRDYDSVDSNWTHLGVTPLKTSKLPINYYRLKIVKPGFSELFVVAPRGYWEQEVNHLYVFANYNHPPDRMTKIPGTILDPQSLTDAKTMEVQNEFWMDQYEVSNRDFQKFVDQGGYQNRKFWKVPFVKGGHVLSFEEAMTNFKDATGRPGPLDWEVGHFLPGQEDFPVTGVSWYEAAAYAEFAGKSLPTIHHWYHAAGSGMNYRLFPMSNFGGQGPHAVGDQRAMSPYGTYDMAGNVSEWCWNEIGIENRSVQGGSFQDPAYMFYEANYRSPFDRDKSIGFRCVKYLSTDISLDPLLKPYEHTFRDYSKEKPVSDEVFAVLKTFYDYNKTELNPLKESVREDGYVIKEKVAFTAAYGNERIIAYLFLPKNVRPPYQTIVYFPHGGTQEFTSSEKMVDIDFAQYGDFLIRSGRAFIYPIYKSTYERGGGPGIKRTPDQLRELRTQYVKDFRRTIDYLETRQDINKEKIAYYGTSWGARIGNLVGGVENRLQTMILEHGGLSMSPKPPEADEINFAPRIHIPILMINGSYDHAFPLETSQKPMFALLGTPEKDKMHYVFKGGHSTPRKEIVKVVLDWLDRYLGSTGK